MTDTQGLLSDTPRYLCRDRREAGRTGRSALGAYRGRENVIVLGVPTAACPSRGRWPRLSDRTDARSGDPTARGKNHWFPATIKAVTISDNAAGLKECGTVLDGGRNRRHRRGLKSSSPY